MRYLFYFLIPIFFASCSAKLTPFTQRLYDEYNWSERELKKIQFYLSENIILWREAGSEETRIKNGKIRVKDGRKVEEVLFKKGTPGVLVFSPKENRFAISFDKQDEQYLMFGPNPKANNRYVLLGKKWDRRQGEITYNGNIYNTSAENAFASLLVDIDAASQLNVKSKTVKGRKVQ
jgi:hypothetical protein